MQRNKHINYLVLVYDTFHAQVKVIKLGLLQRTAPSGGVKFAAYLQKRKKGVKKITMRQLSTWFYSYFLSKTITVNNNCDCTLTWLNRLELKVRLTREIINIFSLFLV